MILDAGFNEMYHENYINAICILFLLSGTSLKHESKYSWEAHG